MQEKLMPERISRTEEKPFSKADLELLKAKRNKELLLLLSGYLPFVAFGIYILLRGPESLNTGRHDPLRPYLEINVTDDLRTRFWTIAPYFVAFLFIILNIYFAKLYFQSIRPLMKDIKGNAKNLLFFKPVKNPMLLFNKYFLSTPLYKNQQIEISREDFESIADDNELCLEVGPDSTFILRLLNGEKEIKYY